MPRRSAWQAWVLVLPMACASWGAQAESGCRIAFDMGSSGVRAGASNSAATARVDIDYLTPIWRGQGLAATFAVTSEALRRLPEQARFDRDCERAAGGFSAWRLAWSQQPEESLTALARVYARSGVPVLVVPQSIEGAYGYAAASQALGKRLQTTHVLDLGGGSLQVAGSASSFGVALGQKQWLHDACQALRPAGTQSCRLQPMGAGELTRVRNLAASRLQGMRRALGEGTLTLTAISKPVTRGVKPAIDALLGRGSDESVLTLADLSAAIEALASRPAATDTDHGVYLLSDMLLVEGVLRGLGLDRLDVHESDAANLPGLLADDRLFQWGQHYGCYLERLRQLGEAAYFSDPRSCAAPLPR